MDIKGELAYLTPEEERAVGHKSPIPLDIMNNEFLLHNVQQRLFRLEAQLMADDDELLMSERAKLQYDREDIVIDRKIVEEIGAQLMVREVELYSDTK